MELEWQLEDDAQWELLFLGEEVFWKTTGAIRAAGYDSIYSLAQDVNEKHSPTPLLTRESQGSRGTRHLRLLIPKGIAGVSEKVSSTEKDEAKHGSNEPDVSMAVEGRTSKGD
jgi:hypothetical protein